MSEENRLRWMICLTLVVLLLAGCGGAQAVPTATPVPPTAMPADTPVPPTATPTSTPLPPTATSVPPPTATPIPEPLTAATVIASGNQGGTLARIATGAPLGTLLIPSQGSDAARKRWLAGQLQPRGSLVLDSGAVRVLREAGSSLLAVGVRQVKGQFQRGEVVVCVDEAGNHIARGLINFSAEEARKIKGQPSSRFNEILGYVDEDELIHRDNLVLL